MAASWAIEEVKFIGIFFDGDFRSAVALPVNCLFPSGGGGGGGGGAGGTGATGGVGAFCLVSLAKGGFWSLILGTGIVTSSRSLS